MIKKEQIKELLCILEYKQTNSNVYTKSFNNSEIISIDLKQEIIIYPKDLKVNDKTTSNFEHSENFVVFECVNRLLNKGYKSKNIEIEPRWQLGRGASGGKADILVKDNDNHEYLIIECKTFGNEFEKAWKKTLFDGDQLFSYAQQIHKTKYLCLYASDIEKNNLIYINKIITIQDNDEYIKTLKPNKRLTFKDATDVKELYNVWKEVYNLEYEDYGIFEENIQPYEIGEKKYIADELKKIGFDDTKKKYNEFETILRQHNISGHENAFDKLVNIFLAKIVDEIEHPNALEFNWRGIAYDDYYQLQDRLQKLYKDGMQKFLNEEVTYIDNNQISDAFKFFKNDPDATRDKVLEYFRELKFYTNNDFAFIDVHNENLFKQNSEILLKIVKMFQDIKLKTSKQNQFLGDLFEGFLDDGVKQSEGQYFTPLPITRFIISSLPLAEIIENSDEPPKVIDYACGAGHFLNEYASQLKNIVPEESLSDYYSAIDGIEKEYRLSKVAKVSSFMYGQDNINIFYGDALSNISKIKDESYSILIANPPFSVKGFLETLDEEERNAYNLTNYISKNSYSTNKCIETFFIEKAEKLLKPNGIAAIILPAPILKNGSNLHKKTREIILSSFDVISITELPKGTFGATKTPTVVLFLRKKENNPSVYEHYKNRVDSWFSNNFSKDKIFEDKDLLLSYLKYQNINIEDYIELINRNLTDNIKKNSVFKKYINSKKIKSVEQIIEIEKDKLLFYMITSTQKNKVVVINAPEKPESSIKEFLGYEWSSRRSSKGINYIGSKISDEDDTISINKGIEQIITPLFNPNELNDPEKFNTIIRNNFKNIETENMYENVQFVNLMDMLDFSSIEFDKQIQTSNFKRNIILKEGYNLYSLSDSDKFELDIGERVLTDEIKSEGNIPIYSANVNEIFGYKDSLLPKFQNFDVPSILWGIDGDWNVSLIEANMPFYPTDHCGILRLKDNKNINLHYLKYLLEVEGKKSKFSRSNRASLQRIQNLNIQIPKIDIQNTIVDEIEKIELEIKELKNNIATIKNNNNIMFKEMFLNKTYPKEPIENLVYSIFAGGDTPNNIVKKQSDSNPYPVYGNGTSNKGLLGYTNQFKADSGAITVTARGTIGHTEIRNEQFVPAVRLITLYPNEKININFMKYAIDNANIIKTGNGAGQLTVPDFVKIEIILPDQSEQRSFSDLIEKENCKIDKYLLEIEELQNEISKKVKKYF